MDKEKIIQPHARGEYDKLNDCYEGLAQKVTDSLNETEIGIYSDCFLLHARNLIDFLCNKEKKDYFKCPKCKLHISRGYTPDDVVASDFFCDKNPPSKKTDILTEAEYDRINKQLSHITRARLKGQINFFDERKLFESIFNNIKDELKNFDQKINQEYDSLKARDLRIIDRES
ncbi:MAG: hypothetical protein WC831_02430 [Parcubacteria group bacterium]|jgi:hypothetical protein